MKTFQLFWIIAALAFAGCGKKENVAAPQPASTQVPATIPVSPQVTQALAAAAVPAIDVPRTPAATIPDPPAPAAKPAPVSPPIPATPPSAPKSVADVTGASPAAAPPTVTTPATPASIDTLGSDQIANGLKQALGKGLQRAVAELGRDDGFLTNLSVRIPMPEKIQQVEKAARAIGQGKLADEFIATMNHAAEQSVPVAAGVFSEALTKMTIQDAQGILQGPTDAATQFFRRTTDSQLREKFLPIVKESTAKTGVTSAYKQLMAKASFASPLLGKESMDLDGYVTTKAMDGLFKMVAEEEKRIRENPVARTTEVLKSVFGRLTK